jgi:hypothetical protein
MSSTNTTCCASTMEAAAIAPQALNPAKATIRACPTWVRETWVRWPPPRRKSVGVRASGRACLPTPLPLPTAPQLPSKPAPG